MALFAALMIASTSCFVMSPRTAVMTGTPPSMPVSTDHTSRRWGLREPRQKAVARRHHGSLVQVGHRCASLSFDLCAAPFFLEVIPLAPLVSAGTPPVALTGFPSGLALSDLVAVPGNVLGGQARWEIPQALGEFSTQPLVLSLLATTIRRPRLSDAPDAGSSLRGAPARTGR